MLRRALEPACYHVYNLMQLLQYLLVLVEQYDMKAKRPRCGTERRFIRTVSVPQRNEYPVATFVHVLVSVCSPLFRLLQY